MQNIVLAHNHFDEKHLEAVKQEMLKLGAPTIRVYDLEFDGLCQAIEGCHRLRACEELGIIPNLVYVDSQDLIADIEDLDWNGNNTFTIVDEIGDWENYTLTPEAFETE